MVSTTSLATRPSPGVLADRFSSAAGYWIAGLILLADQSSKYVVHEFTPYGWNQAVTGFFNLVHVWNYGAAFSFLADAGGWQRFFFGGIALLVSAWLIYSKRSIKPSLVGTS